MRKDSIRLLVRSRAFSTAPPIKNSTSNVNGNSNSHRNMKANDISNKSLQVQHNNNSNAIKKPFAGNNNKVGNEKNNNVHLHPQQQQQSLLLSNNKRPFVKSEMANNSNNMQTKRPPQQNNNNNNVHTQRNHTTTTTTSISSSSSSTTSLNTARASIFSNVNKTSPMTNTSSSTTLPSTIPTFRNQQQQQQRKQPLHNHHQQQQQKPPQPYPTRNVKPITLPRKEVSIKDLTLKTGIKLETILKTIVNMGGVTVPPRVLEQISGGRNAGRGVLTAISDSIMLPVDVAELLLLELGLEVEKRKQDDKVRSVANENTPKRPPIVCVMGHVDHGKTTLLDALRKTSVASSESGGITQTVTGFFLKDFGPLGLCVLDTPGHAAFSSMRKHGVAVTDVVIIAIAVTDGVMPQTIESIRLARAAKLPIVFALTKTDLARKKGGSSLTDAEFEAKIIDQLNSNDLFSVDDLFSIVVAPSREGLDLLIENVILQAESSNGGYGPRANPDDLGEAVVLESRVDRAMGVVADVVVRWGKIKVADFGVVNHSIVKIRTIKDLTSGELVSIGHCGRPLCISGFEGIATPGDDLFIVSTEQEAKKIAEQRLSLLDEENQLKVKERKVKSVKEQQEYVRPTRREKALQIKDASLIKAKQKETDELRKEKQISLILKANSEGTLDALKFAMNGLIQEKTTATATASTTASEKEKENIPMSVSIVRTAVGPITEQDLELAEIFNAKIVGFNVKLPANLTKRAKSNAVQVFTHNVIYNLVEEISALMDSSQKTWNNVEKVEVLGKAQILQIFELSDKTKVAGCRIVEGQISKSMRFNLTRGVEEKEVLHSNLQIDSLRVLKKEVALVEKGSECGISLKAFGDYQVGDIIEGYQQNG